MGCTSITPTESTETQDPTIIFPTPEQTTTPDPGLPAGPISLLVWVPAEFDPNTGDDASTLLLERIDDFSNQTPGVRVEVRVKNIEGSGNLLESLSSAKEAAPLALPDLVALPGDQMQIAASQNLIYPLESFLTDQDDSDWYEFALELGQYQNEQYGIPFAAQALVMAYHPIIVGDPPSTWEEIIQTENVLAFPAADPNAYYTLALYQSIGGEIFDENGDLQVDRSLLGEVFNYYFQASTAGVMPLWLNEITSDNPAWGNFMKNQSQMVISWSDRFFDPSTGGVNFTAFPTKDGTPFTYTTGWVWGLTGYDPSRYQVAVDLAEFLTESNFLGEWNLANGYLPTKPGAVAAWPSSSELAFASQILPFATLAPEGNKYPGLGESLAQATIKVLNLESTPGEAVDEVLGSIED